MDGGRQRHLSPHRQQPSLSRRQRASTSFRLAATKTGYDDGPWVWATASPGKDYDTDDDGLLEITTLAQLNAMRWDMDGDGVPSSGNETAYNKAFPKAHAAMGCNEDETDSANQVFSGYELRANLDFNTNGSAKSSTNPTGADSGDTYWNGGLGWEPIGGVAGGDYTGDFNGNTYTISHLFIDRTAGNYVGLFADLNGANRTIENVAPVNVDMTLNVSTGSVVYVGALAGIVRSGSVSIEDRYSTGRVRTGESATEPVTFTTASRTSYVGGLAGLVDGAVTSSYSLADVTANTRSSQTGAGTRAGGLVGETGSGGSVTASFSTGATTATGYGATDSYPSSPSSAPGRTWGHSWNRPTLPPGGGYAGPRPRNPPPTSNRSPAPA